MKQRQLLTILTGGALLAGLLSGCGGTGESGVSASVSQESPAQSLVEEAPGVGSAVEEAGASEAEASSEQASQDCTITLGGDAITVSGNGAAVAGSAVTITQAGCYHISGTLQDGQIIVETDKDSQVILSLEGADVTCSTGAPVYVKKAGAVYIETAAGTENILTDGTEYVLAEGEDEPDGAIFSKDDLYFTGNGTLTVNGSYDMAVHGKDSVYVQGGTLILTAAGDGLKGKDRVEITGGNLTIDAGSDGIQSTNDTEKGDILISGGTVTVTAVEEGVKAEHSLIIQDGTLNVTAGGDGLKAKNTLGGGGVEISGGSVTVDAQGDGIQSDGTMEITGGAVDIITLEGADNAPEHAGDFFGGPPGWFNDVSNDDDTQSAKGLKALEDMTITGGTITIDAYDDTIHGDSSVTISGDADLILASGDDGVHANDTLSIQGGFVEISQSYEGLEALFIDISGGEIHVTASDDGMNANGDELFGPGFGGFGGSSGETDTLEDANTYLHISGGLVYVDATGDGLDSNGLLLVEGGEIYVSGPTNSMNGALDSGTSAQITGGKIVAAGASGMDEVFDSASTQPSLRYVFSSYIPGDSRITLTDGAGTVLMEFLNPKQFNSVVISHPDLTVGETYTLTCGDETVEVTLTDTVTSNSGGFGMGRPGGFGGGPGGPPGGPGGPGGR